MPGGNLISKKDVLSRTGISYSQLYRWKRQGLIPESWFVRQSTFTGQETVFPRDKILARVSQIQALKKTHTLDELAEILLSPQGERGPISYQRLQSIGWADDVLLKIVQIAPEPQPSLDPNDALCLGVLRRLKPHANKEELTLAHNVLREHLARQRLGYDMPDQVLHFVRKRLSGGAISAEVTLVLMTNEGTLFDSDTHVVVTVDLEAVQKGLELDLAAASLGNDSPLPDFDKEGTHA
jgi:hypothetical protein